MKLAIEILHEYPLALEAVRDWFIKKMKKSLDEDKVAEDFKEQMLKRGVPDTTLAIMLDQNPRSFFDVLDENRIFVEILLADTPEGGFYYSINGVKGLEIYETRIPCERDAVIYALSYLD